MEFGRVTDISGIDLGLPPDDPATARVLGGAPAAEFSAQVGLPVWNDDALARRLAPAGVPKGNRLRAYSRLFDCIELNSSGYALAPANARAWSAETPPGFRFHPKVPRDISHSLDLSRVHGLYEDFARTALLFGDRLGTALLQFPESFGPARLRELEGFLRPNAFLLPLAVEVRHPAFFAPGRAREALFGLLEETGVSAVLTDAPGRRDAVHMRLATRQAFLRFCGHDRSPPDLARLEGWTERFRSWRGQGLERLVVIAHHVPVHISADWAAGFASALNRALGTRLTPPRLLPEGDPQLDLFAT